MFGGLIFRKVYATLLLEDKQLHEYKRLHKHRIGTSSYTIALSVRRQRQIIGFLNVISVASTHFLQ